MKVYHGAVDLYSPLAFITECLRALIDRNNWDQDDWQPWTWEVCDLREDVQSCRTAVITLTGRYSRRLQHRGIYIICHWLYALIRGLGWMLRFTLYCFPIKTGWFTECSQYIPSDSAGNIKLLRWFYDVMCFSFDH